MNNSIIKSITKFSFYKSHSNVYGLTRTLFAFSTILTLYLNENNILFPSNVHEKFYGLINYSLFKEINLFLIFHDNIFIAKTIAIIILLFVLIGFRPRYTVILHWWVSSSFLLASPAIEGGDQLIAIITFLFIPIGLSDNRVWHWSKQGGKIKNQNLAIIINSFYVVIRFQVFVLYLQAFAGKLSVKEWTNGTVLYYWFEDNIFGLNDTLKGIILPTLSNYFFVSLLTYSVLVLELSLALGLVMSKKRRKILLYLGIIFHFFIWLVHGLPTFFITMAGALIIYIIPFYEQIDLKKLQVIRYIKNSS